MLLSRRYLGSPPENWIGDRVGIDDNVTIVGGAQTGPIFAHALRRAGIGKVSVIEAAPDAARAGIWRNIARMRKLRTEKRLVGPDLGNPHLSFQAWYECEHGPAAYDAIDRIALRDWIDYMDWFRAAVGIEVAYGTSLSLIEPAGDHLRLHLVREGCAVVRTTRKVILANGLLGGGGAHVPAAMARLPRSHWSHTADSIDFAALRGRTVAVVGGAASAFDAAATALEAGATKVHLCLRRDAVAAIPVNRSHGYPGANDNYPLVPDTLRWRQMLRLRDAGSMPPPDAVRRAVALPGFVLHPASPWLDATIEDGRIRAELPGGPLTVDFAIAATGYFVDPAARPELAAIAGDIALWQHRYYPTPGTEDAALSRYPYLGNGYEYQPRQAGTAPWLRDIHVFNVSAQLSFGQPVGDIPSFRRGVPALVSRIGQDLFLADLDCHAGRFARTPAPAIDESLYASALHQPSPAEGGTPRCP